MIYEPTLSSLFHELFSSPWAEDDPEFMNEIKHYQSSIERLLTIENQLNNFIQTQPLLENDQITSIPCANEIKRAQIKGSVEPSANQESKCMTFTFSMAPVNIGTVFSSIILETGCKRYEFVLGEAPTDCIKHECHFKANQFKVTCNWNFPLLHLSPPLQKFMNSPFGIAGEIAQKILAHVEMSNLLTTDNGDIKCDNTLQAITSKNEISIFDISDIISKNTKPIDPFVFELDLPQSSRSFNIQYPFFPSNEITTFNPIRVHEPPIRPFLQTAIESKNQLNLYYALETNPVEFVDSCVTKEAKKLGLEDISSSTYYFLQPWILESASDFLKSTEYISSSQKPPPILQAQFR